ncbi:MAG: diaminopimelate epimerase [Polyangiaceae bacterium]|nr:diaminopimelate epimerase [Polyangiaceae bacterium]
MRYTKYHGLGNDYLVVEPSELERELGPSEIELVCHRNYGAGSDGILWGPLDTTEADFALRIFNPDGSEAEKSGNGLRIFSRYLFDTGRVKSDPFTVLTLGGKVRSRVHPGGRLVDVEMGRVSFDSTRIPVAGPPREVINETIEVLGRAYTFCAATIGNPHCVLPLPEVCSTLARSVGPVIEVEPRFPNRTNVQLLKVLGRSDIQIEIWERGAGYTLASGSSSSAAAAVARKLGLCDREITVHMPGGRLKITVEDDFSIGMTGPVTRVGGGALDREAFTASIPKG